jgi:NitT/TauT family transport system permease protein
MKDRLTRVSLVAALIVIWEIFSAIGVLPHRILPPPSDIFLAVGELIRPGLPPGYTLLKHLFASLVRVFCGFILGALVAIPLGIVMGWSRIVRILFEPVLQVLRPIPPLAWIPIAILWFGIGLKSASFIIFLGVFFPVLLNTISGVDLVDQVIVKAARTLGANDYEILRKVLMPGALPSIITGLRVGLGIGWMTLVAAEFTGVKSGYGLGYMIMVARDIQRPDEILAGMLVIGLVGILMDTILKTWEKRILRWREK